MKTTSSTFPNENNEITGKKRRQEKKIGFTAKDAPVEAEWGFIRSTGRQINQKRKMNTKIKKKK